MWELRADRLLFDFVAAEETVVLNETSVLDRSAAGKDYPMMIDLFILGSTLCL